MGSRYKRRSRSLAGGMAGDVAFIANRLSWQGALILGSVAFLLLYFAIPAWITYQLSEVSSRSVIRPFVEMAFSRRVHWIQWIGTTLLLVCIFISGYKFHRLRQLGREDEHRVGLISRIIARFLS